MRSPTKEILRAYFSRPYLLPISVFLQCCFLFMSDRMKELPSGFYLSHLKFAMGMHALSALAISEVTRALLQSSATRMAPAANRRHLEVIGWMSVLIVILIPLAGLQWWGVHKGLFRIFAVILFNYALALWLCQRLPYSIFAIQGMALVASVGGMRISDFWQAGSNVTATFLYSLSFVILMHVGRYWLQFNEAGWGFFRASILYGRREIFGQRQSDAGSIWRRHSLPSTSSLTLRAWTRLHGTRPTGLFADTLRWRAGENPWYSPALMGVFTAAFLLGSDGLFELLLPNRDTPFLFMMWPLLVLYPSVFAPQLAIRKKHLGLELLRSEPRQRFVMGLVLAAVLSMLEYYLCLYSIIVLALPWQGAMGVFVEPSILVATLSGAVLFLALSLIWLRSLPDGKRFSPAWGGFVGLSMGGWTFLLLSGTGEPILRSLLFVSIVAVIGLFLTYAAYQRLLETDLSF